MFDIAFDDYGDFVVSRWEGPSACVWLIPGTWEH